MSVELLAHALHYAVLGGGVLGLVVLLAPQVVHRQGSPDRAPLDDHERRVALLRSSLGLGDTLTRPFDDVATRAAIPASTDSAGLDTAPLAARLTLPVALIGSTGAAGVHAAVGPAHFREGLLLGSFFALSALCQLAWAALALSADGASRGLLIVGIVGNLAAVGLWAISRTVGLPGILAGPEAVGPWDVTCVGLELVAAAASAALLLGHHARTRCAAWAQWHPVSRWFLGSSVLVLVGLSLSGAGA